MMRLLAITPLCVTDEELARRQQRYDRLAPSGVSVTLLNLGTGSEIPRAFDTAADIAASEAALLQRFRAADAGGYGELDAFLPDCVLDPVVDLPNSGIATPVFGLLKLTAHFLLSLGATVGAVARNEPIARELDRKFASYGLGQLQGTTSVLALSVEDISNDALWASAVSTHLQTMDAEFVINGCSAVEVLKPAGRPGLVDPTATALKLLGLSTAIEAVPRRQAGL
jgi:Asp/Glu/hydantoin racemase